MVDRNRILQSQNNTVARVYLHAERDFIVHNLQFVTQSHQQHCTFEKNRTVHHSA